MYTESSNLMPPVSNILQLMMMMMMVVVMVMVMVMVMMMVVVVVINSGSVVYTHIRIYC